MTTADTTTPIISPICCFLGVAPTRKPVFRSWEVSPAMAAMTQMMPPMTMAAIMPWIPSLPVAFSSMVEISRVAMAMPDTGLLEEPIRPTIREETVAKKKPNTITIRAVKKFRGMAGSSHMTTAMSSTPSRTSFKGRSCSVRRVPAARPLP